MKNTYEQLLRMTHESDPTERLCSVVMKRIERRQLRIARQKTLSFGLISIFTIAAIIPTMQFLIRGLNVSGIGSYVSLLLSDGSVVSHWQDIILAITDSFPMFTFTVTLALAITCLLSFQRFSRYLAGANIYSERLQLS